MIDILNKQLDYLERIEKLGIDDISVQREQLNALTSIVSSGTSQDNLERVRYERNLDELERIKKVLEDTRADRQKENDLRAQSERVTTTLGQKFNSFKDALSNIKKSFSDKDTGKITGKSALAGMSNQIGNVFSQRHVDRNEFLKTEKALGSGYSDERLKRNFNVKNETLLKHRQNEQNLEDTRGSASKEEFLASGSDQAKAYLEEKKKLDEILSAVDTRYRMRNTLPETEENNTIGIPEGNPTGGREGQSERISSINNAEFKIDNATLNVNSITSRSEPTGKTEDTPTNGSPNVDQRLTGLQTLARQFRGYSDNQHNTIGTLSRSNLAGNSEAQETQVEDEREKHSVEVEQFKTDEEQTKELVEQSKVLKESLEVQKKILEKLDNIPSNGRGLGLPDIDLPDMPSNGKGIWNKVKGVGSKIGNAAKGLGNVAIRGMGGLAEMAAPAAAAVAAPLAVGAAIAAPAIVAAHVFSDSFGEGGFDVVKKLQDDKIIDYNATIAGFNPSEVLDWKGIEELPPEDLKKLLDSGVTFSPEDTTKMGKIYEQNAIKGGKVTPNGGNTYSPEVNGIRDRIRSENIASFGKDGGMNESEISDEAEMEAKSKGLPIYNKEAMSVGKGMGEDLQQSFTDQPTLKSAESIKPTAEQPTAANEIYGRSEENAGTQNRGSTVINNVSSPTNNISNQTSNGVSKGGIKNQDSSVNKLFASRLQFF